LPHHRSAKKRLRQNEKRRLRNRAVKSRVHTAIRKLREASPEEMPERLRIAMSELDNALRKGVLKEGTVNRRKSRLARWVNKQLQAATSTTK
jgi:small subunit ribosomal protein S20